MLNQFLSDGNGCSTCWFGEYAFSLGQQLDRIDDFVVSLTTTDGTHRSFRTSGDSPKVEIRDPLQPHKDLLRVYTDKDIHNVTAFLVTLK